MRDPHPPVVATWLLKRLGSGPYSEPLLGDIIETYRSGRSNRWYWKQTLAAIVVSFVREVRANIFLGAKAVVTGWAASYVLFQPLFLLVTEGLLARFHLANFLYFKLPLIVGLGIAPSLAWLVLWTPIWVGSGWLVGRLNRAHLAAMTLLFAASVLLWKLTSLPWTVHSLFNSAGDSRYLPQLVVALMNLILPSLYVVIGGLLAGLSNREPLSNDMESVP